MNVKKYLFNITCNIKLIEILLILSRIAVRSGDYYLFEDLDEKVELDLLFEQPSAGIDDAMNDHKLSDKLTIEQVRIILHGENSEFFRKSVQFMSDYVVTSINSNATHNKSHYLAKLFNVKTSIIQFT